MLEKLVCVVGVWVEKKWGAWGVGWLGYVGSVAVGPLRWWGGVRLGKFNSKIWNFTAGNKIM